MAQIGELNIPIRLSVDADTLKVCCSIIGIWVNEKSGRNIIASRDPTGLMFFYPVEDLKDG